MARTRVTARKSTARRPPNIGSERRPMNISSSDDSSESSDNELQRQARACLKLKGPLESTQAMENKRTNAWLHGPECMDGCKYQCWGKKAKDEASEDKAECPEGCMSHHDCIEKEMRKESEKAEFNALYGSSNLDEDRYFDYLRLSQEFYKNLHATNEQNGDILAPEPEGTHQHGEQEDMEEEEFEDEEEFEEEEEEEEEMEDEEMALEELEGMNIEAAMEVNPEPLEPQPLHQNQVIPQNENHGFANEGLLPDPFAPDEEEEPQSDITDVDNDEPRYVIGKDMYEELIRYLNGGGGPGGGAEV